jgi:hypothetical protein
MSFLYPHKPDSKPADSCENDKPVKSPQSARKPKPVKGK